MTRFTGLNGLDRLIYENIDTSPGFFFEAGANNGINQSNTFALEESFGWKGILVEPIPRRFEECKKNRPHSQVFWGALTSPEDVRSVIGLTYCDLMTVTVPADGAPQWHGAHVEAGQQWLSEGDGIVQIEAPALTISGILESTGDPRIDLMTLDLEGYEPVALRGLDLSRHRPRHIVVELRHDTGPPIEQFLAGCYGAPTKLTDYGGHWDAMFTRKDV